MPRPITDPLHSGALRERADLTLAAILRALLVTLPVLILASLLSGARVEESLLLGLTLTYVAALFVLQRRGRFAACVYGTVFGLMAFSALVAAFYGSVRSVGTLGQIAAITVGGIFLGRRALVAATAFSIALLGALIYAENAGWLPVPNYRVTPAHWVIYGFIVAAVAVVLAYMRSLLLDVVGRLQGELAERRKAEQNLQLSEAKYAALFATSPDGVAVTRFRDGVIIEANDEGLRQMGLARDAAVGRSVIELGVGASAEDNAAIVAELRAHGRLVNRETRFRRADGAWLSYLLSAVPLKLDGRGCVLWSWRDVTGAQRAEAEKRQALERFQQIFENSPESITISRLADGRLLAVNDVWLGQQGLTRAEAIGRTTVELGMWSAEDRAPIREALAREGRVSNVLRSFRRRDGSTRESLMSLVVAEIDGEPCIIGMGRDVTAQRRAEEERRLALEEQLRQQRALTEMERRFEKAFHSSQEAIAISTLPDGRLASVNRRSEELYGAPATDMVGRTALELGIWDTATADRVGSLMRKDGKVRGLEVRVATRGGDSRVCEYSADILELDGKRHAIAFLRDITEQRRAEEELRSHQRLLEIVIDAIPMNIFAKDLDSNYIMLNRRMAEFFGRPKEEILRQHTSRVPLSKETRDKSLVDDALVFANRRTLEQPEVRLAGHDGRPIPFHSTKIPLLDEAGKLIGLLGINRDISEEKRAQTALRESEHRYRSLFQAATDCILVLSPAGDIVDINDYGCRTLGYSYGELVGGTFARILDETKLARLFPRAKQVAAERRSLRAEQELRAKDGSPRTVEFTASGLPDGNVLVIVRDVTERRRHERLLENVAKGVTAQTGAEFFRTLVQALARELPADMVFIGEIAESGDHVRTVACCADGATVENFEYALAGSPCVLAMEKRGTVVHAEGVAQQFPEDKGLARHGISGYAGTSLFDSDGKAIGILVALMRKPIERRDFTVSLLEIFAARAAAEVERARADAALRELNVSLEQRVRERTTELELANRDLESFGYSVSHDLRSPLGAINGYAYLLRTGEGERMSGEGLQLLERLERNAGRLTMLVEGLLEFSRLGRKPVVKEPVAMAQLVAEVVAEVRAEQQPRNTEVRVGALPAALGDAVLLRQVWKNLIGNAVKYSRGRNPAVVEIGFDGPGGAYVVSDNGAGFDMEHAARLFGVFERLHGDSEFEGSGVGLAIVQRIVQCHGGTVSGEGRPGEGATFRFALPPA